MSIRLGWCASVPCALLVGLGCGSDIPPRAPDLGSGTSITARDDSGSGSSGKSTSKPSKPADTGTKSAPVSIADNDAGALDQGRGDHDAGSDSTDVGPRAGHWIGTTSQMRAIEFDLTDKGLTQVRLSWFLLGCGDGDNTTDFAPPVAVGDDFSTSFTLAGTTSVTLSGTFNGDDSISGALTFASMPAAGQLGCIGATATWMATRQAP